MREQVPGQSNIPLEFTPLQTQLNVRAKMFDFAFSYTFEDSILYADITHFGSNSEDLKSIVAILETEYPDYNFEYAPEANVITITKIDRNI